MTYQIQWTSSASRALERVSDEVATAAAGSIYTALAEDPRRVGNPPRLEQHGLHSARRGDYRVVFSIDDEGAAVSVMAIQHRADVHRRRWSYERRPPAGPVSPQCRASLLS